MFTFDYLIRCASLARMTLSIQVVDNGWNSEEMLSTNDCGQGISTDIL